MNIINRFQLIGFLALFLVKVVPLAGMEACSASQLVGLEIVDLELAGSEGPTVDVSETAIAEDQSTKQQKSLQETHLFISPTKSTVYFPNNSNDGGLKVVQESLKKTGPKDIIFVDLFVLTDTNLAKSFMESKKAGTTISINLCSSMRGISKKSTDILEKGGISVNFFNADHSKKKEVSGNKKMSQTLHKKVIGWTYHDHEGNIHYRIFHGSRNPTFMTQSFEGKNANKELMIYEVDKATYDQFLEIHNFIKKMNEVSEDSKSEESTAQTIEYEKNSPIAKTPPSKQTIVSYQKNICSSIAGRIANTEKGGKIWLAIYALNHPEIMESIKKVDSQDCIALMILDQGCLKNEEVCTSLKELDAKKIKVFNPAKDKRVGRCPTQCHIKVFVRQQRNQEYLVGLGSTNFTTANNNDINNWTFYPKTQDEDNTELAEDIIAGLQSIEKECIPFSEALSIVEEQQEKEKTKKQEKKKQRRKDEDENKKAKKQKTEPKSKAKKQLNFEKQKKSSRKHE